MRKLMLSAADLQVVSFVVSAPPETRGTAYANESFPTNGIEFTCGNDCLERRPMEEAPSSGSGGGNDEGGGDGGSSGSNDEDSASS
jgi:hypothetical protein